MRVAAYTDYTYHRLDGAIHADRAFALFLARLADEVDELVIIGRVDPAGGRARYPIGTARFVELPFYTSLSRAGEAVRAMPEAIRTFWSAVGEVDCVWLLGPHPLAVAFAAVALLRRKRVVLGVRQDFPEYVRNRHSGRPLLRGAALALEGTFRAMARASRVIVVGPDIARNYARSRRLLEIAVSLVGEDDLVEPSGAAARPYDQPLRLLSVGRLDAEKNPLLLADVLAELRARGGDWRLAICGEGEMRQELGARLRQLGVEDAAEFLGYVPLRPGLLDRYRTSHALLHVSWTEGLPQVLIEACASGLPVVATDVGGVAAALGDAVLLVPPGDRDAAVAAAERIARDPDLRAALISAGNRYASSHTLEAEVARVAAFMEAA